MFLDLKDHLCRYPYSGARHLVNQPVYYVLVSFVVKDALYRVSGELETAIGRWYQHVKSTPLRGAKARGTPIDHIRYGAMYEYTERVEPRLLVLNHFQAWLLFGAAKPLDFYALAPQHLGFSRSLLQLARVALAVHTGRIVCS
jgi:hypothetical protein